MKIAFIFASILTGLASGAAAQFVSGTCGSVPKPVQLPHKQIVATLAGVVTDKAGAVIVHADVKETTSNWSTVLRTTTTNGEGHWSFPVRRGQRLYYFEVVKLGFSPVRFIVKVNKHGGKALQIALPVGHWIEC
jgi:Carboxypeptidase regulatory-like domain